MILVLQWVREKGYARSTHHADMKCENVGTAGDDGEQCRANDASHVHQVSRRPNPMVIGYQILNRVYL